MFSIPSCPKCNSQYTYEDGFLFICPECAHEWTSKLEDSESGNQDIIRDANGNELQEGDDIIIIKDLKVKGSSSSIKMGTKVKDIRLIHGSSDGHDIDCKIDGFGAMKLKSEFVKKS